MNKEKTSFVTINISKGQLLSTFKSSSDNKLYSRILTPDGYTFIRPAEQIKESSYNEKRLYFSLGETMTVNLQRSIKTDEVGLDGKPVYTTEEKTVTATELKEMYSKSKNKDRSQGEDWVVIRISKGQELSKFNHINDDNSITELSRIITPEGETFIRQSNQLRDVKGNPNVKEFSLNKENSIRLTKTNFDVVVGKTEQGKDIYETVQRDVTATELFDIFNNRKVNKEKEQREHVEPQIEKEIDMNAISPVPRR